MCLGILSEFLCEQLFAWWHLYFHNLPVNWNHHRIAGGVCQVLKVTPETRLMPLVAQAHFPLGCLGFMWCLWRGSSGILELKHLPSPLQVFKLLLQLTSTMKQDTFPLDPRKSFADQRRICKHLFFCPEPKVLLKQLLKQLIFSPLVVPTH